VSELETKIRDSAQACEWTADWDDVLRRSGHKRHRSRRAAAIAALTVVAVVLLMPGIGIGGGLNALISHPVPPGLQFAAEFSQGSRLIGTVTVQTSRLFVHVDPKSGTVKSQYWPSRGAFRGEFRWNLDLTGAANVSSLQILDRRSGRVVARLCSPCQDGAHGTFRRSRAAFAAVFGRGKVVAETSRGTSKGSFGIVYQR